MSGGGIARATESTKRSSTRVEESILERRRATQRLLRLVAERRAFGRDALADGGAFAIEEARERDDAHELVRRLFRLERRIPFSVDAAMMLERDRDPERRTARAQKRARP
jgi:hypothetical protein